MVLLMKRQQQLGDSTLYRSECGDMHIRFLFRPRFLPSGRSITPKCSIHSPLRYSNAPLCAPGNLISRTMTTLDTNSSSNEPIHILGIGNLGKFVAHSLIQCEPIPEVTLLFHRPGLAREWHEAGRCIEVVTDGKAERRGGFEIETVEHSSSDGRQSVFIKNLILATKTHSTVAALQPIRHRLNEHSTILFLQNGMGTVEEVTKKLFPDPSRQPHYLAGIISHGVFTNSTFSITHAGLGTTTIGRVLPTGTSQ